MKNLIAAALVTFGFAGAAAACPTYQLQGPGANLSGSQIAGGGVSYRVVAGGNTRLQDCTHIRPTTDRGPGVFTQQPDFTFGLSNMGGRQLVVSVVSQCDAALLINTATATWYYDDDDNGNLDPRIVLTRPANGRLDVWVGTYDGNVCDAVLNLRTQ